jgi:hypothetical protein
MVIAKKLHPGRSPIQIPISLEINTDDAERGI